MPEVQLNTENVKIRNDSDDHMVAVVGIKNIEVIRTPKMTVIVNKDSETLVDDLLDLIEQIGNKLGE